MQPSRDRRLEETARTGMIYLLILFIPFAALYWMAVCLNGTPGN
jgi:hypothetical protein